MAGRLAIDLLAVDHLEVIDLAAQDRLTAYDASCLWLVRRTGGELAAVDQRLLRAAGPEAVLSPAKSRRRTVERKIRPSIVGSLGLSRSISARYSVLAA